jgi:hypothetical protein
LFVITIMQRNSGVCEKCFKNDKNIERYRSIGRGPADSGHKSPEKRSG